MQASQFQGIAAVVLDVNAFLGRRMRRSYNDTLMAQAGNLPLESVTTWARLVAEVQLAVVGSEFLDELYYRRRLIGDLAVVAYVALSAILSDRNGNGIF